ncbi:TraQ conjugal transfer family protein [Chryseobacterium sp. S-02]|uniref:TraQ conjugal transfer family protein n=1 Tax=Chryseobacterium sp. S-02 TaxID=3404064 RepID=UPI003CEB5060
MKNAPNYNLLNLVKFSFILVVVSIFFNSCQDNDLEIKQNFPFEVKVMPVPSKIKENETVEIRMSLETASNFSETKYTIRYFQYEGTGKLQHSSDAPYLPNDEYTLPQKQFRLYYTSESQDSHVFSIWITDSFDNEKKVDFEFDNAS